MFVAIRGQSRKISSAVPCPSVLNLVAQFRQMPAMRVQQKLPFPSPPGPGYYFYTVEIGKMGAGKPRVGGKHHVTTPSDDLNTNQLSGFEAVAVCDLPLLSVQCRPADRRTLRTSTARESVRLLA